MNNHSSSTVMRLTALWALSESGLGGIMHAFKIPFTGFFLGGFAIVIVTLLAAVAEQKAKAIMQATLLVVLVKAAASPHSPPMAYIAVAFQGLVGALFYGLIPSLRFAAPWFGAVALLESAVQKFLVMTLLFGKSVWEALDLFVAGILKDFHINNEFSFSYWLMGIYTIVYVVWGFMLGWWASGQWDRMYKQKEEVMKRYQELTSVSTNLPSSKKKSYKWLSALAILLFIVGVFSWNNLGGKAGYAVLRTIAALLLIWFVLNPVLKWLIQRWVSKQRANNQQQVTTILALVPELKNLVQPAYELASQQHQGLRKYKVFVEHLLVLALFSQSFDNKN